MHDPLLRRRDWDDTNISYITLLSPETDREREKRDVVPRTSPRWSRLFTQNTGKDLGALTPVYYYERGPALVRCAM